MVILSIDDDEEDTELFCEAVAYLNKSDFLDGSGEALECLAVNSARQAMEVLSKLETLPDYIFLDINMPLVGGKECLARLKAHPDYSKIPTIMLSTNCGPRELKELKAMGASDCVQKPNGFNTLVKILAGFIYAKQL